MWVVNLVRVYIDEDYVMFNDYMIRKLELWNAWEFNYQTQVIIAGETIGMEHARLYTFVIVIYLIISISVHL